MAEILSGAVLGGTGGFVTGLLIAAFTRDGIWPQAWLFLIATFTAIGSVLGAVEWLVRQ